jgi:hypothetical protein
LTGPQGAQGLKGDKGDTGPQGPAGVANAADLLSNPDFLNALATNPAFLNALANTKKFASTSMGSQTITFSAIPVQKFKPFKTVTLKASSSAKLTPITFTCADPTIGIISGNVLLIQKSGTTTVTATQAGNESINPAVAIQRLIVQ